jgi:subtilisin family serine protease
MRRFIGISALIVAMTASLTPYAAPISPAPPPAKPAVNTAASRSQVITLITGDKVRLTTTAGKQTAAPMPAPGRDKNSFSVMQTGNGLQVIPSDAMPLLASGRLDRRLFDVSGLAKDGFDDAQRVDIPLLETGPAGTLAPRLGYAQRTTLLPKLGVTAVRTKKSDAGRFWRSVTGSGRRTLVAGVSKLWLDGKVQASLDQSVPQIGAPQAWKAGFTGKDVPVAVLDSGLDASHPDFAGAVLASKDFSGSPNGTKDVKGHGTHVASTVAGSGAASGGKYRGVAPGAMLLIGKVLGDDGGGSESAVLAGMQWAVDQHARVVNLSLGTQDASDGTDPVSQALNTLSSQSGALFVVAAGNSGPNVAVASPAAADAALAVAAVTKQDQYVSYSNPGPRVGNYAMKPDISAPGVDIVAARAAGGTDGVPVNDSYTRLQGTSMASPHVAGAAAILAQEHPDWKADQLKSTLMSSSLVLPGVSVFKQGAGRVDVGRAYAQKVTASSSLSFGDQPWPHDGQRVKKTITYHNDGDAPVTLTLTPNVVDPSGKPASDAALALSARSVTVPAHGESTVDTTFVTAGLQPGTYGGWITASTAGGCADVCVHTSVGGYVEPKTADLTVTALGRDGKPAASAWIDVVNRATGQLDYVPSDRQGVMKLRSAVGRLAIVGLVSHDDAGVLIDMTMVSQPDLDFQDDTAVTFDARKAGLSSVNVDQANPRTARALWWRLSGSQTGVGSVFPDGLPLYTMSVGSPASDFTAYDQSTLTQPDGVVTGPGYQVRLSYLGVGPRSDSHGSVQIVNGGTGSEADLSTVDVRGTYVLAIVPDTADPYDIPAAVAAAGGVGLILGGPGMKYGGDLDTVTIPTFLPSNDYRPLTKAVANGSATVALTTAKTSPYRYDLLYPIKGQLPTGGTRTVGRADLAHVHATYRNTGVPHGMAAFAATYDGVTLSSATPRLSLPSEQDQYVSTSPVIWQFESTSGDFFDLVNGRQPWASNLPRTFQAGQQTTQDWNAAVFAPQVSGLPAGESYLNRTDNVITGGPALHAESGAHHVTESECAFRDQGTTELLRDGQPVSSDIPCVGSGMWQVPAADAAYQLSTTVHPIGPNWLLSTKISATWSFRSADTPGTQVLPLLDIRYAPRVDTENRAPVNVPVPITIGRQTGSSAGPVTSLQLSASFDDGKTWVPVSVTGTGDKRTILVPGGKPGGFVSLRANVSDASGNSLNETIIHAYTLR